eukprot:6202557-Prymnesium_polylepis.1
MPRAIAASGERLPAATVVAAVGVPCGRNGHTSAARCARRSDPPQPDGRRGHARLSTPRARCVVPRSGREVAARWPRGGCEVAARWLHGGFAMAARWPRGGCAVAARWLRAGAWWRTLACARLVEEVLVVPDDLDANHPTGRHLDALHGAREDARPEVVDNTVATGDDRVGLPRRGRSGGEQARRVVS